MEGSAAGNACINSFPIHLVLSPLTTMQEMAAHAPSWSYIPFSKNPWQIREYKFHKKLVKGRTLFTTGSDFWITDSFNRGEKAMKP